MRKDAQHLRHVILGYNDVSDEEWLVFDVLATEVQKPWKVKTTMLVSDNWEWSGQKGVKTHFSVIFKKYKTRAVFT